MSKKLFMIGSVVILMVAVVVLLAKPRESAPDRVTVSFLGCTNLPNGQTISALVSINNNDSVPVRFDLSSDVEGAQEVRVQVTPRTTMAPLECGKSLTYAVDAPPGQGRWRVRLLYYRCTANERLYNFAWRQKIPSKLGNSLPRFVYPAEHITNGEWLTR